MANDDETLRKAVREVHTDVSAPDFAVVFAAAERELRSRQHLRYGSIAAAVVIAILAVSLQPVQQQQIIYIDVEELAASTSWHAPSDSLLPDRRFDIYQEIPRLFESTEPDGGTLL